MRLFKKLIKQQDVAKHCDETMTNLDFDSIIQLMEERLHKLENGEINNPSDFPIESKMYQFVEKCRDAQIARLKEQIAEAKKEKEKSRSV